MCSPYEIPYTKVNSINKKKRGSCGVIFGSLGRVGETNRRGRSVEKEDLSTW